MDYQDIIETLKPLEGQYVTAYTNPGAVFILEQWVEEVIYLPPNERQSDTWGDTVILWTGLRDEKGIPTGMVISAEKTKRIRPYLRGSFRMQRTVEYTSADGDPLTAALEIVVAPMPPKHLATPLSEEIGSRFIYSVTAYKEYVAKLVAGPQEARDDQRRASEGTDRRKS